MADNVSAIQIMYSFMSLTMNQLFLSLLLLFPAISAFTQSVPFPRYGEVITRYFNTYSGANQSAGFLAFEKHPDGWHVVIKSYELNYPVLKDELIWSKKEKSFKELNLIKKDSKENDDTEYHRFLDSWDAINYNCCPYYGYSGWEWETIEEFKNATNLSDTLTYALGRAYSSYASNLLNNNSGLSDPLQRFKLAPGKNAMSAEQLQKYRHYRHLAIDYFKKVKNLNPGFETIVGDIGVKWANEYVTSFLDLRVYQNEEEALKELPDSIYSPFYISLAKNYLMSCEKDGVLFTNGDNDTYPLLYVQEKLKFRKDVLVINESLFQTPDYINSLREKRNDTKQLQFTISNDKIKDSKRDVILLLEDPTKTWELAEAVNFINNDENVMDYSGTSYPFLRGKNFTMKLNGKRILWNLEGRDYILKNDLMMLDLIANNSHQRPIHFCLSLGHEGYLGFQSYLGLEGIAYKLTSQSADNMIMNDGHVNADILFNNIMNRFDWNTGEINRFERGMMENYTMIFYWLANEFLSDKNNTKAKQVLDKYFTQFPNTVNKYGESTINLMTCYYRLGENNKANEIGKTILQNIKDKTINQPGLFYRIDPEEYKKRMIARIRDISFEYKQQGFYAPLLK